MLPKDMLPKDTMDVKEAARYLAMDERTVAQMAIDRLIPALEHEGKWLFSKKSIDKWRGRSATRLAARGQPFHFFKLYQMRGPRNGPRTSPIPSAV